MKTIVIEGMRRVPPQRIANLGPLHACIVGTTSGDSAVDVYHVAIWNDVDRVVTWPLPGVSANTHYASCYLLPTVPGSNVPGFLVAQFKAQSQQTQVVEFKLPADPFTVAPVPAQTPPAYGDSLSTVQMEFVALPGGVLISATHQQDLPAFDALVRGSNGVWLPQERQNIADLGLNRSYQWTACWAPWGALMWAQDQADSEHFSDGATFEFKGGKLARTAVYPKVTNETMGVLANNQEDPAYVAVADPANGCVQVSYTNTEFVPGVDQMAYPVIAAIRPGVVPTLTAKGSELVKSILNPSPVIVRPGKVTLCYVTGETGSAIHCEGQVIPIAYPLFAFNTARAEFVVQSAPGVVSLVQLDAVPIPEPIPIPTPPPKLGIVSFWFQGGVFYQPPELGKDIVWESSVSGVIGRGPQPQFTLQSVDQTITASVTDAAGRTAQESFSLKFAKTKTP